LSKLLRIIRYTFPNSLNISFNRGQWRLQIMRNIRNQLFAALFHRQLGADRPLQLTAHLLVRANDAAHLIANLRVQTEVQIPFRDTAGALLELSQRPYDILRRDPDQRNQDDTEYNRND